MHNNGVNAESSAILCVYEWIVSLLKSAVFGCYIGHVY